MEIIKFNFTDINSDENDFDVGLLLDRDKLNVDKIKNIILSKIDDYTNNDIIYSV